MEWRKVAEFANYEVSDGGFVRIITGGRHTNDGEILAASNVGGYMCVTLFNGGARKMLKVHRLVALAFLPPPDSEVQFQVAHNDGDSLNNVPTNLRWATCKENLNDRNHHGTSMIGNRNGRCKLTESQVIEIRTRYKQRCPKNGAAALGREFGVTDVAVIKAFRGENWSSIPSF
jgi:hypothetical protein